MKVTTELKNLIKGEFAKKKEELEKEIMGRIDVAYKEKIKEIEEDVDYIKFKEAASTIYDKYKKNVAKDTDYYYPSSYLADLYAVNGSKLMCTNKYNYKRSKKYIDEMNELTSQEQALLIKLTYEKDLERIKETLVEYGINIL